MNSANEVQESIKIALDAADAATDVTSEYNKIKSENKKLEASVKQIHKFTTIIFVNCFVLFKYFYFCIFNIYIFYYGAFNYRCYF